MLWNKCNVLKLVGDTHCPDTLDSKLDLFKRNRDDKFLAQTHDGITSFTARGTDVSAAKVYGILVSANGCALYVPVGRQHLGGNVEIRTVPICVGGGRDIHISAAGIKAETDEQVLLREAREELNQPIEIANRVALPTSVPADQAAYFLIRIKPNLSRIYYTWTVTNSDQVCAVRYWDLPTKFEVTHGQSMAKTNEELALKMFDELQCSTVNRDKWKSEWHGIAYGAAVALLLKNSINNRFYTGAMTYFTRWYGATKYSYVEKYKPYPTTADPEHETGCDGRCNSPAKPTLLGTASGSTSSRYIPPSKRVPQGSSSGSTGSNSKNWRRSTPTKTD